jgi:predicted CXXCH cytochrome family protein
MKGATWGRVQATRAVDFRPAADRPRAWFGDPGIPAGLVTYVILLLALAASARANTHPPLPEKVDDATCLECHETIAKGKAVHSAISIGCSTCHEARVNNEATRMKLVAVPAGRLCLQCHADKDARQAKGHVHSPAVRDCLSCHDPHSSNFKNQLLKSPAGEGKENLCLTCHSTGLDVAAGGSRHAALDMGCDSCHESHKVGTEMDGVFHLTKSAPGLCMECHDVNDAALVKAHRNLPFQKADCVGCHDPHQSSRPKLLQAFVHRPFEESQCETCHSPAKNGKVVLTKSTVRELCVGCHQAQAKKIEDSKVQHPGAAGDCTDCHSPHAGTAPGFLKPDAVNVCLTCHSDQAELHSKRVLHQPAFKQGCAACHDPHGGDHPKLLRAEGNALCLECHGPEAKPTRIDGQQMVVIFDGKVRLPENYFSTVIRLPLQAGVGHPMVGHPVTDVPDPLDGTKVKKHLSCLSCHQPHASAARALLVNDQSPNLQFCRNCHAEIIRNE